MKEKHPTIADIRRLEEKINLLSDKLDRLMEAQGVTLERPPEQIDKEDEKKRLTRERQQAKILREQQRKLQDNRAAEDRRLSLLVGPQLQAKFNLIVPPSTVRIREYQRTNDPRAFDGLKRRN